MLPHLNARQDPGRWRPFFRQGAAPAAKMAGLENRRPQPGEELGFLSSAEQMQARGERKLARLTHGICGRRRRRGRHARNAACFGSWPPAGARSSCRPWRAAHEACQSEHRCRPSAAPRARSSASHGDRRAGLPSHPDGPSGCPARPPLASRSRALSGILKAMAPAPS
jgi:hypothetical protein